MLDIAPRVITPARLISFYECEVLIEQLVAPAQARWSRSCNSICFDHDGEKQNGSHS
jgi:hypothetical protein